MSDTADHRFLPVWEVQAERFDFRPSALSTAFHSMAAFDDGELDEDDFDAEPAHATDGLDTLTLEQQLADAYRQGVTDGQNQALAAQNESEAAAIRLAEAIDTLKPQLSESVCILLIRAMRTMLEKSVGFAEPDAAMIASHCDKLAQMVSRDLSMVTLEIHPADLALLSDREIGLPTQAEDTLRRGTLRLSHADGWIEQGTQPLLDEMQAMLDDLEAGR